MGKLNDLDHAYNGLIDVINNRDEQIAVLLEERNIAAVSAGNISKADKDRTKQKKLI